MKISLSFHWRLWRTAHFRKSAAPIKNNVAGAINVYLRVSVPRQPTTIKILIDCNLFNIEVHTTLTHTHTQPSPHPHTHTHTLWCCVALFLSFFRFNFSHAHALSLSLCAFHFRLNIIIICWRLIAPLRALHSPSRLFRPEI